MKFLVPFYHRFVDVIFVILDKQYVELFHAILNSMHPAIQFPKEVENKCYLSFLDVCVIRGPCGTLQTTAYRKTCDTGNFLSFNSHHPIEHKQSVVRALMNRSKSIPSSLEHRKNATLSVLSVTGATYKLS